MESKRTLLNNILRIVSNGEELNKELKEAVFAVKADSLTTLATLNAFVTTQKTLVAMLRELINEVKNLRTAPAPMIQPLEKQPIPLVARMNNDFFKAKRIATKEKDLFSRERTHYNYGENETISMSKAVKDLIKDGISLTDKPYRFFHKLVTKFHIPEYPTKSQNAKSGNYRISRRDYEKIKYILTNQEN